MNPARWQQVKTLFAAASVLSGPDRITYLDQACGSDTQLRTEIDTYLFASEQADDDFLSPPDLNIPKFEPVLSERQIIGRRIGSYEIIECIGVGGMGEVYRASRADDQYRKFVAIKLIRTGPQSGVALSRFKNERQILAELEHPHIARLLDGGATEDGMPYFVMELVEGKPIDVYCQDHALSIPQRLRLFLDICSAVQFAHQRLVVHRDLKPGNILVTEQGEAKLLDFGIAKILNTEPQALDQTLSAFRQLTPLYASPEQILGLPITTASDVYSLGIVLYELLTGRLPYTHSKDTVLELSQEICDVNISPPSLLVTSVFAETCGTPLPKLRRELRGDLDNILLMALRKEPDRRYSSVEQFAEDIRRHLESTPVLARTDTLWYRASKFIKRHRFGVVAFAVVLIAILSTLSVALYEARMARQQAAIASQQRLRAERRFNDVRKLANSLIFELHDSIKDLPGATPTRKLLVDRALEYLDGLSQEAKGDITLQRELASAYDRLGDLRGYSGAANLGDFSGALISFKKALAIRESAASSAPNDIQIQSELLNTYFRLSFVFQDAGDSASALDFLKKGLPVAQRLATLQNDSKTKDWLAGIYWKTGSVLSQGGKDAEALENFRKAVEIRETIATAPQASPIFRTHLAADYIGLGSALDNTGHPGLAVENLNKAIQILERLSQTSPNNATLREYLAEAYARLSAVLKEQSRFDESLAYGKKADTIFSQLIATDPTNSLARVNDGLTDITIGEVLVRQGRGGEAIPYEKQAISHFQSSENKNRYNLTGEARAYSSLANAYCSIARREPHPEKKREYLKDSRSLFQLSLETWRAYRKQTPLNQPGQEDVESSEREAIAKAMAACQAGTNRTH
jgi:eukaryotic-like serine/threonine-protein kinase